ncbi:MULTISPECIES: hypothetical protein [Erysipelotrichaceae]|nr:MULTISPECIES: hypothetical protein [Erysipelotrichaceae]
MKKRKCLAMVLAAGMLAGCSSASKPDETKKDTDLTKTAAVKPADQKKMVLEAIKGWKDKFEVEQGISDKVLTHYLEYDDSIIKNVTVDSSAIKWDTPGIYYASYIIQATLPETEGKEEKDKSDSDTVVEVTEKVPVTVLTPEEAEKKKAEGEDVILKDDFQKELDESEKKDKDETDKKDQTEDKKTDKTETVKGEENKTESKPSGGSTADASKPDSESSKPSDSNKPSGSGSTSSSKPSTQPSKPAEPSKPAHTHSWVEQFTTVSYPEEGHNEQYVIKEAWTEQVPVYGQDEREICNGCGADITADPWGHIESQWDAGIFSCGGYHSEVISSIVGYDTITHPAEYGTRWVVDKPARTEQVSAGFKCSCGATK